MRNRDNKRRVELPQGYEMTPSMQLVANALDAAFSLKLQELNPFTFFVDTPMSPGEKLVVQDGRSYRMESILSKTLHLNPTDADDVVHFAFCTAMRVNAMRYKMNIALAPLKVDLKFQGGYRHGVTLFQTRWSQPRLCYEADMTILVGTLE